MADDIYGTDIAQTTDRDWGVTAQSDVAIVAGPDNLQSALERRWDTPLGALFYAPDYGNTIFGMLSENITDDWIQKTTVASRTCLLGDPRLSDVQVTVTPDKVNRRVTFQNEWTDINGNTGTVQRQVNVGV